MGDKWFNGGRMGDEKNYVINYLHGKMPQDIKIMEDSFSNN